MAVNRKLGRPTDQRLAILRNQTTDLILHNQIETTEARAKEVKSIVDSIIALAIKEKDNFEEVDVKVVKAKLDSKGNKVTEKVGLFAGFKENEPVLTTLFSKADFTFAMRELVSALLELSFSRP